MGKDQGCHGQRKTSWKEFFPSQGNVREFLWLVRDIKKQVEKSGKI